MNKIIVTGNLARDPEVRYTQSGKAVATFSLAVSRGWKNKSDNQQPSADFFNIVAWEKTADFCGKYLAKGSRILVEGRLQSRSYEAQDGSKRYTVEIIAENIEFAGAKNPNSNGEFNSDNHSKPSNSNSSSNFGDDMIDHSNNSDDIDIPF